MRRRTGVESILSFGIAWVTDIVRLEEKGGQRVDGGSAGAANQGRCLPLLGYKACRNEALQVVRQSRGRRDPDRFLQAPDGHPGMTGAHKGSKDQDPGRAAERVELLRC